ncbi:RNA polymerase sigma-70 factor (ECF subfamily) [Saccharopolyspora lacisalsi]|uniref:RNA polymerase sigma-70 factor (ECF subfamily) n=1 Tax=Halosaccharopolyspora lacisalsi TaxID=1000566 RepID=A0A839DSA1_9PSEU|nr:ECF RNA polymerase sigma factor SigK [Halosaccharopolyspora lacisalsi]MBA8823146.1 RNA polymerase sigma-70 factor (ECF subfamily) [Halosaccharopolyspora lacisalsi]
MEESTSSSKRPARWFGSAEEEEAPPDARQLLAEVAKGDERAFEQLYDMIAGALFGLIQRIVRDAAQSEEVAQEVLVEVWRTATHYRPERGSVQAWVLTLAHRRAVDRVRSAQAATAREARAGSQDRGRPFDEVSEAVTARWERQQVRRCVSTLTELQRESVMLTYYQGYTFREAAGLLSAPSSTVKTRLRDGLIRLRDCLGVGR